MMESKINKKDQEKYDITSANGVTIYHKKGTRIFHREDGPAIINIDGSEAWYLNGILHCEDGPAVVQVDGNKHWHINGEMLTEEEFNERMSNSKVFDNLSFIKDDQQVGGEHYKSQSIQPWDYMKATMPPEQFEGYLRGNVIKYISRYDKKNGVEDLKKAKHYLEKLIESKGA